MSTTNNLFSGWLGFGTVVTTTLVEPSDAAYLRRPVVFGPLFAGAAQDTIPGTIGPATSTWAPLTFAGLFDAQSGGNLLATWPLARPVALSAGQTWTSQGAFTLCLDGAADLSPVASRSWPAGVRIGTIGGLSPVTAMLNLQLIGGALVGAQAGGGVALGNGADLPSTAPATGSGQLWNNGGVICVA